jgi:hypothetical protein
MIDPPCPRSNIAGAVARTVFHSPVRLTSITSCHVGQNRNPRSCTSRSSLRSSIPRLRSTRSPGCRQSPTRFRSDQSPSRCCGVPDSLLPDDERTVRRPGCRSSGESRGGRSALLAASEPADHGAREPLSRRRHAMAGRIDTDREAMDLLVTERHVNGDVTHEPRRLPADRRGTDPAARAGRVSYPTGGCDRQ